jgi:hypothetical protein
MGLGIKHWLKISNIETGLRSEILQLTPKIMLEFSVFQFTNWTPFSAKNWAQSELFIIAPDLASRK